MKNALKTVLLFVVFCTGIIEARAQAQRIALPAKQLTRREAIAEIEKQTDMTVDYSRNRIDDQQSIHFSGTDQSLTDILDRMTENSSYSYRIGSEYILIYPERTEGKVAVNSPRKLIGVLLRETDSLPLADMNIEAVDVFGKKAKTDSKGRFVVDALLPGQHIIKISSADGSLIRYRDIDMVEGRDTDVTLTIGEVLHATVNTPEQPENVIGTIKSTAFYVPTVLEKSGTSFTGHPRNMFVVSADDLNPNYLPQAALKINLLYLATTSLNLGFEFALARKWTFELSGGFNMWELNKRHGGIRHWLVQPELRYWFCNRFERHFIGLHGIGGEYQISDIDLKPFGNDLTGLRYDGWGIGGGVSYGYHLPMGKRWAWEFTVGAGYIYLDYDKYNCGECDNLVKSKDKHYFGPTKAGISLIYMIK